MEAATSSVGNEPTMPYADEDRHKASNELCDDGIDVMDDVVDKPPVDDDAEYGRFAVSAGTDTTAVAGDNCV